MRFLLVLVALLSGLSLPQAVAVAATGRVDSSVVASESIAAAPVRNGVRAMAALPVGKIKKPAPTTIWLPTVALAEASATHFGDRARE